MSTPHRFNVYSWHLDFLLLAIAAEHEPQDAAHQQHQEDPDAQRDLEHRATGGRVVVAALCVAVGGVVARTTSGDPRIRPHARG